MKPGYSKVTTPTSCDQSNKKEKAKKALRSSLKSVKTFLITDCTSNLFNDNQYTYYTSPLAQTSAAVPGIGWAFRH